MEHGEDAMRKTKLTASQRRKLGTRLRKTHDVRPYRRLLAVLEFDRGKSVSAIAELLGVSCQSVYNWITRFKHGGDGCELSDAPRSGRPTRAGDTVNVSLQTLLILSPEWFGYYATHWAVPLRRSDRNGCAVRNQLDPGHGRLRARVRPRQRVRRGRR